MRMSDIIKYRTFVAPPSEFDDVTETRDYCVRSDKKRFEWVFDENGLKCLIWAFLPAKGYEGYIRGMEIADRAIAIVTNLENTEDMSPERRTRCPFRGDFFAVCQSLSTILVTKDAVYEEDALTEEIKKVTPEPVELHVWVAVEFQTRYSLQFEPWQETERKSGKYVKVEQPASLSVSEIREHL